MKHPPDSVLNLPGVGPAKGAALARLGISTLRDLLYHFPRAYQHRGDVRTLMEAAISGVVCSTVLTVGSEPRVSMVKDRMTLLKFQVFDGSGTAVATFFNQNYLADKFVLGASYRFWGKIERFGGKLTLSSPQYEPYFDGARLPEFVAVYPLTEGITGAQMASWVDYTLNKRGYTIPDPLPDELREKYNLIGIMEALRYIHSPCEYQMLDAARRRFVFEELYLFALGVGSHGAQPPADAFDKISLRPLLQSFGFELTGAQKRVVKELYDDMTSGVQCRRLVSGDVGSGKTAVAMCALYHAAKSGKQAVLMAPTEILAMQHFSGISEKFAEHGISVELLTGSLTPGRRREARARIAAGEVDVIVGTHAVLSDGMQFARLGLVIADEQHRFGVKQREALVSAGGTAVHSVTMSATPIPRTLAMVFYSDLDLSVLDELPPGRTPVDTFVVGPEMRPRINAFIKKHIAAGHQVYVVCPAIEEAKTSDETEVGLDYIPNKIAVRPIKSVETCAGELRAALPETRIAVMHGKLRASEKESIMADFTAKKIDVLVSTTVVEVGVNVTSATLMVIENADRFGLSQLHQLRGRVGRGAERSYCVLLVDEPGEVARARLEIMEQTNDGFVIAERDLSLRGPGDLIASDDDDGIRQHGGLKFRLAGLCSDMETLRCAVEEARAAMETETKTN